MAASSHVSIYLKLIIVSVIIASGLTIGGAVGTSVVNRENNYDELVFSGDGGGDDDDGSDDDAGGGDGGVSGGSVGDGGADNGNAGGDENVVEGKNSTSQPQCFTNATAGLRTCDFSHTKKLVKLSEHAGPDTRHLLVIGAFILDYYPLCLKSVLLVKCFTINHIDYSDPANQCPPLHRAVVKASNVTKMAGRFHQVEVLNSSIISLSLTSGETRGVFTFFDVVIHELYQLIILGFCTFTLHSSRISTIHSGGLVVKSHSDTLHGINFSNILMVETEGILVEMGELTLENVIINKLDFKSIIVNGSGVLTLKNVVLKMAHPRGLVLAGGQVNVINVTCNNILLSNGVFNSSSNIDISFFQLTDHVVPLTFTQTTLGIILILIIIFIIIGIVFCYCIWSKYIEPELLKPVAVV